MTITLDALTADSASFSFTANEEATFQTLLITDGVKGDWEDATTSTKTYNDLAAGSYEFRVKATDADGNAATYAKAFEIAPAGLLVDGLENLAWVLGTSVTYTVDASIGRTSSSWWSSTVSSRSPAPVARLHRHRPAVGHEPDQVHPRRR